MDIVVEIPNIENFKRVNELAVQVHEMHVTWSPDIFKSVEEVISKEYFENLIKNEDLTPKQRRENASKAGKASAKKRAERKTLREEQLVLLSTGNNQNKMSLAMITKAMNGDTKAFEVIRDTIGEKPKDQIELGQEKPFEVNIKVVK